MKVLISSIGTSTSIGLIKSFRKFSSKIVLFGCDVNEYGYTAGSVMVDKFYRCSYANDKRYVLEIVKIIKDENIDLFIPVNDIEVVVFANNKEMIPNSCKMIIPSAEVLEKVTDKYVISKFISEMGLPVPKIVNETYNGKMILREKKGVGSKNIRIIESTSENLTGIVNEDNFLQEYVSGQEYTIDILSNKDGIPVYIIPRKRLEIKAGVATKVAIEFNETLINYCKRILKEVCLPGFSNIQFIKSDNGIYYFIEINPRIGGCSIASLAVSQMFEDFIKIIDCNEVDKLEKNLEKVKWESVVTRYYEEVIYEK